jgi:DNA-binding HxlR family transcriptional regulator
MQWTELSEERCPIARFLAVMGDRWALLIIRQSLRGSRRFEEFRRQLGISPTILTRRLQELTDHGIFTRKVDPERPKRPEYQLTPKGLDLASVLMTAIFWGEKYYPDKRGSEWVLEHSACENEFTPVPQVSCSECEEPVPSHEIRLYPRDGNARNK